MPARSDGKVEVYGRLYPKGTLRLAVELDCYRTPCEKEEGGLGAEQHFRNAWAIMWPKFEHTDFTNLIIHAWCNFKYITIIGCQRASKCLGKDTPILMYDGSIKMVQDVAVGDRLMGDDSTPRTVLSLARGREMMYRVKASRGSSWVCNESHILSFKASRNIKHSRDGHLIYRAGEKCDVPLLEFKKKGVLWKSLWKQYQVGVDFHPNPNPLPVDPYVYGSWLAEGSKDGPAICSYDGPMVRKWCSYWESRGARIVPADLHRVPLWFARYSFKGKGHTLRSNPCTDFIRRSTIDGQRRILREYMLGTREERLQLLAGYIDGDGHCSKGSFGTCSVSEGLSRDIVFVARSLGLYASVKKHKTTCRSRNYEGTAWQVYISGNIQAIPTLQKPATGYQSNDPTCQSITVEPIGEGDFFGFELDGNRRFLLGDFTVTHNTYTTAFCCYLDYLAEPTCTLTSVSTVTFEGLRLRMWSDLLRAAETQSIGNPFTIRSTTNECRVFPAEFSHEAGEKYQIHGMSISRTSDAAGRIRGGHANRRRIVLDEAQDMPSAIFDALVNPMSAPDAKAVFLSNPVERVSEFGRWCEPDMGWTSVDEMDMIWKTKKGGICLRLDGLQSPNIKAGRTLYPYLLTQQSIDDIIAAHGRESVQFYSLVRGLFPPDGMVSRVFPASTIERMRKPIIFDFQPQKCATLDPAFEFDNCAMHFGDLAMPVFGERQYRINCTQTLVFHHDSTLGAEPKDYQIANWVILECRTRGVLPKHFIMDTTGNARGVFAILQKTWSMEVQGVEYGGKATERNLRGDDSRKACDIYKYFVSELWFRGSEYGKAGFIGGLDNLDPRTMEDLYARRYELKQETDGQKMIVENKRKLKDRLGRSPDFGDALVQFGELLIRLGTMAGGSPLLVRLKNKSGWEAQKARAARVNSRYEGSKEFAY